MKKRFFSMFIAMTVVLCGVSAVCFSDNTTNTATQVLYEKGIIDGYDDAQLHPERMLTRAQFAKFLSNSFPDVKTTEKEFVFSDLSKEHWSYECVQKAVNAGWLVGYPDQTFRPDENITYEQAVTVVCRVLGLSSTYDEYPQDYLSTAIEYSVSDKVNAVIGEEINREMASRLILNALDYKESNLEDDWSLSGYSIGSGSSSIAMGSSGGVPAPGTAYGKATAQNIPMLSETVTTDQMDEVGYYEPFLQQNTEEYTHNEENVFKNVVTSPLSTFSIDTDTASYSNLRRFILNGQQIPTGSVRSEELINYFDYAKAETEEGKPFGVKYTLAECPWNSENQLAMITVSGEEIAEPKPSNLVFLLDISGSMSSYNKLPLVKRALSMLLDKLGDNDRVSIVTYASGTGVALEPTSATEKEKILDTIDNLRAGGGTAGASGIELAYEQAEKSRIDGNNRIILCTDGDFNIGLSSDTELEKLITKKRESGIYLSVLGFGMGNYKDSKMETLADKGNGNYAYIDNLREAKKVLVDEMSKTIYTIAKDVKLQTEFNPEKVSQYRLIGYENRVLNNEDFENDQKDAGELGAGATVTVLYEIVPQKGEVENNLKYQDIQGTGSNEFMTVKIRYKLPNENESVLAEYPVSENTTQEPNEDFKFASAVAELGMILNNSDYKGNSTFDTVISLAKEGIGEDEFGLRSEFIQLVDLLKYRENK